LLPLPLPAPPEPRTIAAAFARVALSRFLGTNPPPGIPPPSDCTGRAFAAAAAAEAALLLLLFLLTSFQLTRSFGREFEVDGDENDGSLTRSIPFGMLDANCEDPEDDHTILSLEALFSAPSLSLLILVSASFESAKE
jgi:hypothetical protein